ncbi:hypothetical protein [Streptomyces capitiformicae]|uniref:Uncharacterized protein n=1 Tax=Streptomyces capitiformicae TaxID=2014920 RepID=A0A918Z2C3_9ACTN|nr:hypothetical protein [Streptomyces capitiformicae]GHE34182.1 hypothetical protein GCM10017771_51610 [Streptomyces capitiformicae]
MDAALASLIAVAGTLLGTVLEPLLLRHTTRKDQPRTTAARFASQLSVHRGHLYKRWEIARRENSDPRETEAANSTSNTSRDDVTLRLYELRVLTRNAELLRLAGAAGDATYAVKPHDEDLPTVTRAEMDARRNRALTADRAFLTAAAAI